MRTLANCEDPDEMHQCGNPSGYTLFAKTKNDLQRKNDTIVHGNYNT